MHDHWIDHDSQHVTVVPIGAITSTDQCLCVALRFAIRPNKAPGGRCPQSSLDLLDQCPRNQSAISGISAQKFVLHKPTPVTRSRKFPFVVDLRLGVSVSISRWTRSQASNLMMADFSSFTGKFRANNGLHESSRIAKRPRESLVCNQCRKSKIRCDKAHPCSNCVKKGEGDTCSYHKAFESSIDLNRHAPAGDRLVHLESMVKQLMETQASEHRSSHVASVNPVTPPTLPEDQAPAVDQRQSEESDPIRYVGSTHWSAILDDIHELKSTLGTSADAEDAEVSIMPETRPTSGDPVFGLAENYSLQQIIAQQLPPKVEIDRYLSTYFRGETFIVPFIHTYHFQRQFREFWADPLAVNPLWLSVLFSICFLSSLIGGAEDSYRSTHNGPAEGRYAFHIAAGQCLVLGRYHRPQKLAPEALLMYAHCKNMKGLDPSREAQALLTMVVRMAYEMGYHRDPDSFLCFTAFEGEMRRRFWAVCKQMDLMISFQFGLPGSIRFENCDTRSPGNLLDSDFDAETQVLPASRSESEATGLLWFIVKDRLLPSFGKVCENALSFREKSEAQIFALDQEVRHMHTTIPEVLRTRPLSESIADAPFLIMTRIYIEFIHLKSLCVLHRRYMARGNPTSTRSCFEAGSKLVSQFIDMYKEFSPGGQLHGERYLLTNFTLNDFMLGVMILCLVVHTSRKRRSPDSPIDSAAETQVLSLLEQSYAICVEKSDASRDARRVSQAIRLTLDGGTPPHVSRSTAPRPSPASAVPSLGGVNSANSNDEAIDLAMLSLQPPQDYMQGDEAAFGMLDPFNFMGNSFEGMDLAMADSQIWDQDTYTDNPATI